MLHVGFTLLALLVPSVLPCGHVGKQRAAILPKDDLMIHVHVVVFGKVICAPTRDPHRPLIVTLDLGHRLASPSDYQLLHNVSFGIGPDDLEFAIRTTDRQLPDNYRKINSTAYAGQPAGVKFALSRDYSYDTQTNCVLDKPRVSVRGQDRRTET